MIARRFFLVWNTIGVVVGLVAVTVAATKGERFACAVSMLLNGVSLPFWLRSCEWQK